MDTFFIYPESANGVFKVINGGGMNPKKPNVTCKLKYSKIMNMGNFLRKIMEAVGDDPELTMLW